MNDNLQDPFGKRLRDADIPPPEGTWKRIEKQLTEREYGAVQYRYAVMLLLLISSSIGFFLINGRGAENGEVPQLARSEQLPEPDKPSRISLPRNTKKTLINTQSSVSGLPNPTIVSTTIGNPLPFRSDNKDDVVRNTQTPVLEAPVSEVYDTQIDYADVLNSNTGQWSNANEDKNQESNYTPGMKASIAAEQAANKPVVPPTWDQPLLASLGPVAVRMPGHRRPLQTGFRDGIQVVNKPAILEKDTDDAETRKRRTDRLAQFKTFDVVRGFHLGAFISMTSTWMTRKADYLDHPGNRIDPQTYLGMAFGINAGYDINERWGLQVEMAIRNSKGQQFNEKCIYTGQSMNKELRLWYVRFPLLVKYKVMQVNRPTGRPIVLGVLAGPMVNVLYKKQLYVDEQQFPISSGLVNHTELGAIGGLDMDFYLHKNFYITAGTRLSFASPVRLNSPMSVQLGFTAQFNFRLPPKEKH